MGMAKGQLRGMGWGGVIIGTVGGKLFFPRVTLSTDELQADRIL